jgi:hypothetical protein
VSGLAGARPVAAALGLGLIGVALPWLCPGELGTLAARAGLAGLGVCAAVLLVRRRGLPSPRPALRVTARAGISRGTTLALVEVDGRRFLLGAGERSLELLTELAPAAPEELP